MKAKPALWIRAEELFHLLSFSAYVVALINLIVGDLLAGLAVGLLGILLYATSTIILPLLHKLIERIN